ncbi:MAG TPA: NYN domain-containing protein [Ktedonobacterales bacterium]|nr:NYN domain-containing protein [Ktedonobacterales bacterium]
MGPRTVFVDGYNLILTAPALDLVSQRDMASARAALLQRVVSRYRHTPYDVVIVFDGDGTGETSQPIAGFTRGRVIFSRRGEKADDVIVRMAADVCDAGREAMVYSNDGEVRLGAIAGGATAARADDLRRDMAAAPRLLQKRFIHQQAVRRELERDAEDAEARAAARKKGNARRASRKRGRGQ